MSNLSEYLVRVHETSSFKNKIINGGFDVWQRGDCLTPQTFINGAYCSDRWYSNSFSTAGRSSTIQQIQGKYNKLKMVCTESSVYTGVCRIGQRIEFPANYAGKTMTLSAVVKSNSSNCRLLITGDGYFNETSSHSGNGNDETLMMTITLPSNLSTIFTCYVGIDGIDSVDTTVNPADYFEVSQVQLEEGSIATKFEQRPIEVEEALCHRYYQVRNEPRFAVNYAGQLGLNSMVMIRYHLNTQMRIKPLVVGTPAGNFLPELPLNTDIYEWGGVIYGLVKNAIQSSCYMYNVSFDAEL